MQNRFRVIFFLKSFAAGLLIPIMGLLVLSKGATLQQLPLVLGVYSLTVVFMEFPSGVICDVCGRKNTFLIACIFNILGFILIQVNKNGVFLLFTGFALYGLGRAFASGSIDALVIELVQENKGKTAVVQVNGELGVLESIGTGVGSIVGGILSTLGTEYQANVVVICMTYVSILFLTLFLVKEKKAARNNIRKIDVEEQLKIVYGVLKSEKKYWFLITLSFLTGMLIFSVETYWQSGFVLLMKMKTTSLLGVLAFLAYLFTAVSSYGISRFLGKLGIQKWFQILFRMNILLGILGIGLGVSSSQTLFVMFYGGIYFVLGAKSTTESSILNWGLQSEVRASILSCFSLVFQLGGFCGAGVAALLVNEINIRGIWMLFGSVCIAGTVLTRKVIK